MMWGCAVILGLAVVLAAALGSLGYLLIAVPCVVMMGAMVWMLTKGNGGGPRDGEGAGGGEKERAVCDHAMSVMK